MSLFDRQVIPVPLGDADNLSELILWPQWLSKPGSRQPSSPIH